MDPRFGMSDPREQEFDFGLEEGESFEPPDLDEDFDLSRPHVMTALGPVDPGALGFTLHHEHVFNLVNPLGESDPDQILDDPAASLTDLEVYFASGGRAIVDMGPADYGRSITDLNWIAQRASVHIILVTGHHKHLIAAPLVGESSIDAITARNIAELTAGIDGTATRAGLIKAGSSLDEITEVERRVLIAAAQTQVETGAPISTHTEFGTMALAQLRILTAAGADPTRVIICHLDFQLANLPYLREILATGAFVSFDHWSKSRHAADADRAAALYRLAEEGFVDQLLVSGDLSRKSNHTGYGGSPGFEYFLDHVPLILMEAGFDGLSVRKIFVDNPARALKITLPNRPQM
jgi:predicted metal-dependent phosphotriesterase family hydrolase